MQADGAEAGGTHAQILDDHVDGAGDDRVLEDQEEEEEEEEPLLKYQRLGASVTDLLASDSASCLCVASKMVALGTHDGHVYVLDFNGNQIKHFAAHVAAVNDLCFDAAGEYIGSGSDDGTVVLSGLYTDEQTLHQYHRPVKAVALDPDYIESKAKRFAAGGLAGQLVLNSKGWLGRSDAILHAGEGTIHAIKWRGSIIAWANDVGVKLYDCATYQRIAYMDRPRGSPRADAYRPHVCWVEAATDPTLLIGWADSIKIAAVRTSDASISSKMAGYGGAKYVEILATFQTDYYICGIAPYGNALAVLAYVSPNDAPTTPASQPFAKAPLAGQRIAERPEVRILTWTNEELASDALSIHGYEHFEANDYMLAHAPTVQTSETMITRTARNGRWVDGEEPLYYIVSPKDLVVARPRDGDDHIAWLLQHGKYERALAAAEAGEASPSLQAQTLEEVGGRYLEHLLAERQFEKAAALCPKLLRQSAAAWERAVFHFAHLRQLPALASYIPTENPRLRSTVYEVVLNTFLALSADHRRFLTTILAWPRDVYNVQTIIAAALQRLQTGPQTVELKEALAELYQYDGQLERTLAIWLELKRPQAFEFIAQHNLFTAVDDKVAMLVALDPPRAIAMLVEHWQSVPPSSVVAQLQERKEFRPHLHRYLHELFERHPSASSDFHALQVELYADYDRKMLLPFLRSSNYYPLEKALEVCKSRGLMREMVFVLGRMGNSREALAIIMDKLQDVEQAIEFVTEQHDDELWEELITRSLTNPSLVGALLEHIGRHLDPLLLLKRVPDGMPIPRLRNRLVRIVADYRTHMSLSHGCNEILRADCQALAERHYLEAKHGVHVGSLITSGSTVSSDSRQPNEEKLATPSAASTARADEELQMPSTSGRLFTVLSGSGRCCMCLDPISMQQGSVAIFFCAHSYHIPCLEDATGGLSSPSHSQSNMPPERMASLSRKMIMPSANGRYQSRDAHYMEVTLRCVLCTAASKLSSSSSTGYSRQSSAKQKKHWP